MMDRFYGQADRENIAHLLLMMSGSIPYQQTCTTIDSITLLSTILSRFIDLQAHPMKARNHAQLTQSEASAEK